MKERTCCVTGHREIPEERRLYVRNELQNAVETAVANGFTHFISGFAAGVDLEFAAIVEQFIHCGHCLTLEAAIPHAGRLKGKNKELQKLLGACNKVTILCDRYSPDCFFRRNRYMVDASALVIAVYDGRKSGGTYYTMNYAQTHKKELRIIEI